jgi:hypothetical protein
VHISNVGAAASPAARLEWRDGEESLGFSDVPALEASDSTTVQRSFEPSAKGVHAITCSLPASDEIALDNDDSIVIEAVDSVPILVVHDGRDAGHSALQFFITALGYDKAQPAADWHSLFKPKLITAEALRSEPLGEFHAIVIPDLMPLDKGMVDAVRSFVESGGGLWIGLGSHVDRQSYNAVWFDDGAGLSPLGLSGLAVKADGPEITVHPPSGEHPALVHLADTQRLDIDRVRILRHHQFTSSRDRSVSVLLETGTGAPLAVEHYLARGRIIVQALPFDVGWSSIPATKAFVVLVDDWLAYITQPAATQYNLSPGGTIEYYPSQEFAGVTAELTTPVGKTNPVPPQTVDEAIAFRFRQTDLPGRYDLRLKEGDTVRQSVPFVVRREEAESNLTPLSSAERDTLGKAGIGFVDGPAPFSTDEQAPLEKPVWWLLLSSLLVLLAVELLLATHVARTRYAGLPWSARHAGRA